MEPRQLPPYILWENFWCGPFPDEILFLEAAMTRWSFDPEPPQGELVTIRTFDRHSEYLVARALLESAGIECFGSDEHSTRISSGTHKVIGACGTTLQVRTSDAQDAIAILDAPFEESYIVEE